MMSLTPAILSYMAWSSPPLRVHVTLIATALLTAAACGGHPNAAPITTTTVPPIVQPHGDRTNLDGFVKREVAVYAQPVQGQEPDSTANPPAPQRKWTLIAGTEVKVFCQVIFPKITPSSSGLYVSWAPDQYGYIEDAVQITTRTTNTNEQLTTWELKPC